MDRWDHRHSTVLISAAGPVTSAIPTPTLYVDGAAKQTFAKKAITKPARNFIVANASFLNCQYERYLCSSVVQPTFPIAEKR